MVGIGGINGEREVMVALIFGKAAGAADIWLSQPDPEGGAVVGGDIQGAESRGAGQRGGRDV
jgi:hypothetical protein